jgi:hypothetical protein
MSQYIHTYIHTQGHSVRCCYTHRHGTHAYKHGHPAWTVAYTYVKRIYIYTRGVTTWSHMYVYTVLAYMGTIQPVQLLTHTLNAYIHGEKLRGATCMRTPCLHIHWNHPVGSAKCTYTCTVDHVCTQNRMYRAAKACVD